MNDKPKKKDSVEVASDQLKAELTEIKERVGALETIATISNRKVVEDYVRAHLKTDKGRLIMKECAEPRTRQYLMSKLNFASPAALDYRLVAAGSRPSPPALRRRRQHASIRVEQPIQAASERDLEGDTERL